ncbi:hypothetical protein AAFF_G00159580, partial [Aldrovandia affinis]
TSQCAVDGNPPVQRYTWFKNSRAITSWRGSEQSYTIKDIKPSDSGEYYCEAVNGVGSGSSHSKHLNVQYAPKSTSVSVSSSGEIVEGDSVTLTCNSNANPPVQRYTWFKKNDTGVWQTGSGQSLNFSNFRSWNSGQYYCEAENKHGVHNSTALSITTKGGQMEVILTAVGITVCVLLVLLAVLLWMRKRNFRSKSKEDTGNTEQDKEDNTGPVNSCVSGMPLTPAGPQEMATENQEENHYGNIQRPHTNQATKTKNQENSTTIHNPYPQSEDDIQYASIQFPRSSAAPRSAVQAAEDDSVIYSTVNKCKT